MKFVNDKQRKAVMKRLANPPTNQLFTPSTSRMAKRVGETKSGVKKEMTKKEACSYRDAESADRAMGLRYVKSEIPAGGMADISMGLMREVRDQIKKKVK
jgi:hypothetical protein